MKKAGKWAKDMDMEDTGIGGYKGQQEWQGMEKMEEEEPHEHVLFTT